MSSLVRLGVGALSVILAAAAPASTAGDASPPRAEVPAAVAAYYQAQEEGDIETSLRQLAPGAVLVEPNSLPYRGEFVGREGWRRFFTMFGTVWREPASRNHSFSVGPDAVWSRFELSLSTRCGDRVTTPVAERIEVGPDGIRRMEVFYADTAALVRVLDACERPT